MYLVNLMRFVIILITLLCMYVGCILYGGGVGLGVGVSGVADAWLRLSALILIESTNF